MFRKKTRGQVIGAELQEGFAHLGVAATEAGRLAAEQVSPRVAAARGAATPAYEAAKVAVVPKVAAVVAAAAPAVTGARDTIGPRVEAARGALTPHLDAAGPRAAAAVAAAQAAAAKAAADLTPRVEAVQQALRDDVVPRIEAAQVAALAYATPRVTAARDVVTPALESARETLAAGVDSARSEFDARRAEFAAAAAESSRKTRRVAKKARKNAGRKHRDFEKAALATAATVKRKAGVQSEPRRWPWVFLALALGTAVFAVLRRRKDDDWTPAPAGDGPVPSYREDPVPSSDSFSGKTVSTADTTSDSAPAESDMGVRDAQFVDGDGADSASSDIQQAPEPFSGGGADAGPTAGPADREV